MAIAALLLAGAVHGAEESGRPAGYRAYMNHCAPCHGAGGRGDGPIASELASRPADLTRLAAHNGGSFPETLVYRVIDGRRIVRSHGTREMPVWGDRFRLENGSDLQVELRITALIDYLDSIQQPPAP